MWFYLQVQAKLVNLSSMTTPHCSSILKAPDSLPLLPAAGEVLGSVPARSQGHFLIGPSKQI